jgi:hypothetical protein
MRAREDRPKGQVVRTTPAPTSAPPTLARPPRGDLAGAAEIRNAAVAVAYLPTAYRRGGRVERKERNQKLEDWLANVAYWTTYPEGPRKLGNESKDKPFIAAWLRLRDHVASMLTTRKGLPLAEPLKGSPPESKASRAWQTWALTMTRASSLADTRELSKRFETAVRYLGSKEGEGLRASIGTEVGGAKVTASGLVAEIALRDADRENLPRWSERPTRAFFATTGVF